ncbi:MAG: choice-of-anchor Q domain-containing protein [Pedobacter sp.]|uniref:choice-of-anchor Q domain-containing protein n=1 Tax=Pedobacter sp. TaxID=1411316 RepID=UPI002807EB44|nr:choice-of-anchor Q domain-containing protein [Pedobacter sp.]MDQ8005243.1 choice-of-anchor Q domain-containing protein [Pedobacter sp.]
MKKNLLLLLLSFLFSNFYAIAQTPDANGIVYVKTTVAGNGSGNSWDNATDNLQAAINATEVQKVFVAVGNYDVSQWSSFTMKNGVEIYGGFDPANSVTNLTHNRIMPNASNSQGSVLNGKNERPVIWCAGDALNSSAILDGFTITGGYGNGIGGGIHINNSSPAFSNLVIKGNTSNQGGGIHISVSSAVFKNVIITGNTATYNGGGVFADNANGSFINCVIANNTASEGSAINIFSDDLALSSFKNSVIFGGFLGFYPIYSNSLLEGRTNTTNGNIDATGISINDVFNNATGGDYTLKVNSPVINKGSNASFPNVGTAKDLASNPRVYNFSSSGVVDLGAYEYHNLLPDNNGIIYVKPTATGTGNGNHWSNATADLHNAIHTTGVNKVFVAAGNYNVGASSFIMKNDVEIYGGFDPENNITNLTHNRIMPNAANSQGSVLNGEGERPVIWSVNDGLNSSTLLDGFTVTGGLGSGTGGGIHINNSSPTFSNLVIKGNTSNQGGGMSISNSSSVFKNIIITGNTATANSGGFMSDGANAASFVNSVIANNTSPSPSAFGGTADVPFFRNTIIFGSVQHSVFNYGNSLVEGRTSTTNGNINATNITINDVFTDAANGDYTLKANSPVINKGNNSSFTGLTANTKDLAGNPRVYNFSSSGVIDLGAYEYQAELVVLPVTLIDYTAKADGNKAKLQWQTASEFNNSHFEVYRSGDDNKFVRLGEQKGTGNSIMANSYTFYDDKPLNGINYYQLLQVDKDGKIADLGVRTVSFSLKSLDVKLHPNPTDDEINVLLGNGGFTSIKMIDVNGKILQHIKLDKLETSKKISLINYPSGIYFIQLKGKDIIESKKVVKR